MLLQHPIDVSRYVHPTLYTGHGIGSIFARLVSKVGVNAAKTGLKKAIQAGSKIGSQMTRKGVGTALKSSRTLARKAASTIT